VKLLIGQGYNHFDISETLASPYGLLGLAALERMKLAPVGVRLPSRPPELVSTLPKPRLAPRILARSQSLFAGIVLDIAYCYWIRE
jgi:hypothetical protein